MSKTSVSLIRRFPLNVNWISSPSTIRLGEIDENVENLKIPLLKGHSERLHVQPIAGQHCNLIAPFSIDGRAAAPGFRSIDNVVVNQRGCVDELDHRCQLDRRLIRGAAQFCA